MMSQGGLAFSGNQVPQFDRRIVTTSNDLRIGCLGENSTHRIVVSCQTVDLMFGPHIPDSSYSIASSRNEQIEGGMESQTKDTTQMSVIMPNNLIGFKVPAFDLFVLSGTKQVGMAI